MAETEPKPTGEPGFDGRRSKWKRRSQDYREKLLETAFLGFPLAVATKVFAWLSDEFTRQPWQALWFLLPLGAAAGWISGQVLRGRKEFKLSKPFLVFLSFYVLFFSVAAATDFLDWSRDLTVFEKKAPRSWLTPVSAGDWRYRLVPKKDPPPLVVVTMTPAEGRTLQDVRYDLVRLITMAARVGVRGIAFDFYFEGSSSIDPLICRAVEQAGIPVIVGYSFIRVDGNTVPAAVPETIKSCLPDERQGHLAGFLDVDRVVRLVPLHFGSDRLPALSLRVAGVLNRDPEKPIELPTDGLLRFVEPNRDHTEVTYKSLFETPELREILKGSFVLVGERSEAESFETPFGKKLGVTIHADAVHSLLHSCFVRKNPWWFSLLFILVSCYLLTVLAAQGASRRRLILFCAAVSLGITSVSAIGVFAGREWFDVVYAIVAVWLLLPLVLGFRRVAPKVG